MEESEEARSRSRALIGMGMMIAAIACFAVLDTTTKRVTAEVPLLMAVWARYFIQALVTTAYVLPRQGVAIVRTAALGKQVLRGALLLLVTLLAFSCLKVMPVGEFTTIAMTTPVLVTLLAARLLQEHVSAMRLLLLGGAFIGTLIVVRPDGLSSGWILLLPVCFVLVNAAFQLLTSKLTRSEGTLTTHFYTSWVGTLLATVTLGFSWADIADPNMWMGLILMGTAGGVGHLFFIMAFERAPAVTLMPLMYLQIGFAVLGGWLVFDHIPNLVTILGMGIVALCGVASGFLTFFEARTKQRGRL